MRHLAVLPGFLLLSACFNMGAEPRRPFEPIDRIPNQGQYVRPLYLQPEPTPRIPREDLCRARLYLGLVGQHEGTITFAYLPVRTRVLKPVDQELDQDDFLEDMREDPPFMQVREYIPGQVLYGPSIQAVRLSDQLGPEIEDRLTIELDRYGNVTQVSCR